MDGDVLMLVIARGPGEKIDLPDGETLEDVEKEILADTKDLEDAAAAVRIVEVSKLGDLASVRRRLRGVGVRDEDLDRLLPETADG